MHCISSNQCGPRGPTLAFNLPLVHDKELELVLIAGTCDLVEPLFKFLDSLGPFDLDYQAIAIAKGKQKVWGVFFSIQLQRHLEWLMLNGLESWEQNRPKNEVLFQATFVLNREILEPGTVDESHVSLWRTRDYFAR